MKHVHDLTIEEGGRLFAGLRTVVPAPAGAVDTAWQLYLRTLVDKMGETDEDCLNLLTSTHLSDAYRLWTQVHGQFCTVSELRALEANAHTVILGTELRQWLGELLTTREVALWLGLGTDAGERVIPERHQEIRGIWERLLLPCTIADVLRHYPAVVLLDPTGLAAAAVLRRLAQRLALLQLNAATVEMVEPLLAWPGPLLLPFFVELRDFAEALEAEPRDEVPLLSYLAGQLGAQAHGALEEFLHWRLAGDGVCLLLESLDDVVDEQRREWVEEVVSHFHQRWPQVRIVLTSRVAFQREALRAPLDFHFTTIQARDASQVL